MNCSMCKKSISRPTPEQFTEAMARTGCPPKKDWKVKSVEEALDWTKLFIIERLRGKPPCPDCFARLLFVSIITPETAMNSATTKLICELLANVSKETP